MNLIILLESTQNWHSQRDSFEFLTEKKGKSKLSIALAQKMSLQVAKSEPK